MDGQAITFDFHNTLVACPEWFDLEVKHLPSSFLGWWASAASGEPFPEEVQVDADARYRQLRREIMDHGNELTAEASLEAVFTAMGIAVPDCDVAAGIEALMRGALAGASPIAGAVDTVHAIHRAGVTIGVVSSAVYHPFLEWALDAFGVLPAIRAIVTSASVGFYKSRPEIYELAAAAIDADPAHVVHVGDSLRFDVGGASRAGMGTVWLQHEQAASADQTIVPDLTLRTLEGSAPKILRLLERRANGREPARGHA